GRGGKSTTSGDGAATSNAASLFYARKGTIERYLTEFADIVRIGELQGLIRHENPTFGQKWTK
ncbi:hypothetical protein, partial [Paenibacillus chondroitinus]